MNSSYFEEKINEGLISLGAKAHIHTQILYTLIIKSPSQLLRMTSSVMLLHPGWASTIKGQEKVQFEIVVPPPIVDPHSSASLL